MSDASVVIVVGCLDQYITIVIYYSRLVTVIIYILN